MTLCTKIPTWFRSSRWFHYFPDVQVTESTVNLVTDTRFTTVHQVVHQFGWETGYSHPPVVVDLMTKIWQIQWEIVQNVEDESGNFRPRQRIVGSNLNPAWYKLIRSEPMLSLFLLADQFYLIEIETNIFMIKITGQECESNRIRYPA